MAFVPPFSLSIMPDNSLQYDKEKMALETLLDSEEFKLFDDSGNTLGYLQMYYDSLCLHDWQLETHDNHDDEDYARETCIKCKAEREGSTRRDS